MDFSGPWKKWAQMAPNRARRIFFWLIQTLPTFWAERIWILRIFIFWILLGPKFLAWAQLGPGLGPYSPGLLGGAGSGLGLVAAGG